MKSSKQLGIWMDHSTAHIMELSNDNIVTVTLDSPPILLDDLEYPRVNEKMVHNKEQDRDDDFYEKLSHVILNYDEVLLFGPTDAKTELFNRLRENRRFEHINISVESTGKITEQQQHAFLKHFYNNKLNND